MSPQQGTHTVGHKATAGQWRRTYEPHQLELSRGQKSKGTRDLFAPNNSTLLPRESSDTPRHGYGHSAYCWVLLFWTQITATHRQALAPIPDLTGLFHLTAPNLTPWKQQGTAAETPSIQTKSTWPVDPVQLCQEGPNSQCGWGNIIAAQRLSHAGFYFGAPFLVAWAYPGHFGNSRHR